MSICLKFFHNHLDNMQETGGRPPECLKQFPHFFFIETDFATIIRNNDQVYLEEFHIKEQ